MVNHCQAALRKDMLTTGRYQTRSHFLSQCWPRSVSPCSFARAFWVNTLRTEQKADILQTIIQRPFLVFILIQISLKFVLKCLTNNEIKPGLYFPCRPLPENTTNIHISAYFRQRLGTFWIYQMNNMALCWKHHTSWMKCLGTPDTWKHTRRFHTNKCVR